MRFLQNLAWGRESQVCTCLPNFTIVALKMKCGLTAPKVAKIANFGIILPKWVYPLSDFYQIWLVRGSPRSAPSCQISPLWLTKYGPTAPKSPKLVFFWYKFARKGYTPLCEFYKIWLGEGSPRSAPSRQISSLWLLKCGFTAPKIVKNGNFWYTFAPKEKFRGRQIKLDIGAQLQTSLYAITLSISLSHVHC